MTIVYCILRVSLIQEMLCLVGPVMVGYFLDLSGYTNKVNKERSGRVIFSSNKHSKRKKNPAKVLKYT